MAMYNVLLVDDAETVRSFLACVLETAGYTVRQAVDGQQAWEMYTSEKFDVVVSDCDMPRMTGPELADRILQQDPAARIILMSGKEQPRSPVQVFQKPFSPLTLVELIKDKVKK